MPRETEANKKKRLWNTTSPEEPDFPTFLLEQPVEEELLTTTGCPPAAFKLANSSGPVSCAVPSSDATGKRTGPQNAGGENEAHREKVLPKGDWSDKLVQWYSLVARPVPRKEWAKNPAAEAAVAKEWAKLRAADSGRGTWDEKDVREYYAVT